MATVGGGTGSGSLVSGGAVRMLYDYGANFAASAATNTTAITNAITDLNAGTYSELVFASSSAGGAGTFNHTGNQALGAMSGKIIRGVGQQAIKLRAASGNAHFLIDQPLFQYNQIKNLDMDWSGSQAANSSAYGIAVTTSGTDNNTAFYNTFADLRITYPYRGIGINKGSGYATLWGNTYRNLTIKEATNGAIYISNPTGAGMPENLFEHIYIQNPSVNNAAPAFVFQNVEAVMNDIGIEDNRDGAFLVTNNKEQVTINLLHMERHTMITSGARIFDIQAQGPITVNDFAFTGTVNVTGGADSYVFVPGGGYVKLHNLYTTITNTLGALNLFASGGGSYIDFTGFWKKDSGTMLLYPTFEDQGDASNALHMVHSYPGGITGGMVDAGSSSSNTVTVTPTRGTHKYNCTGALTGWIFGQGLIGGQRFTLMNTGSGSITFAAVATSRVIGGAAVSIAAASSKDFVYDPSADRWYPV